MIIVRLMGGLGNQMFQYAAARSLALRHGATVKVDVSFLSRFRTPREYELHHLCVETEIATQAEIDNVTCGNSGFFIRAYRSILRRVGNESANPNVIREKDFSYNPDFGCLPDNVYLDGYWPSEQYFKNIEGTIRRDFQLREPLAGRNLEMAMQIGETEAVSVHVRRGDYVSDPDTGAFHGTCGSDYYRACLGEIGRRVAKPTFYIFSDEPDWARQNLDVPGEKIVVCNNPPGAGHLDMYLMSLCRHNIIANSSFSWWGGWLNRNTDKIVVAPRKWFNKPDLDTRDLIPEGWKRI